MTLLRIVGFAVDAALVIAAVSLVVRNCRKPTRWLGRYVVWVMNRSHAGLTRWGLSHVAIESRFTILDVGCGGGKTIDTLAAIANEGKVYGIDYSEASVAASRRTNSKWIAAGRVEVPPGSVSSLPFAEGTLDLVTAVETHYYWPNLNADFREIRRVLKSGGTLAIVAEAYRGRSADWLYRPAMKLLKATYLTVQEHRELFAKAGFASVEVFENRAKGWICVKGEKPL